MSNRFNPDQCESCKQLYKQVHELTSHIEALDKRHDAELKHTFDEYLYRCGDNTDLREENEKLRKRVLSLENIIKIAQLEKEGCTSLAIENQKLRQALDDFLDTAVYEACNLKGLVLDLRDAIK